MFTDSSFGDYTFNGAAIATDARGNFSYKVKNTSGINTYEFLAIDPFGQQTIRAYPIYYFPDVYSRDRRSSPVQVARVEQGHRRREDLGIVVAGCDPSGGDSMNRGRRIRGQRARPR